MAKKTPRGVRNNNPGNIDKVRGTVWQGQAVNQPDPRFVTFTAPEWGIRAIARVLITYQDKRKAKDGSRIDTVREIVHRWAPATENDTDAYVKSVARVTGIGADQTIDVTKYAVMRPLVEAIIAHECAGYRYPESVINEGLRLAGIKVPLKPLASSRTMKGVVTAAVPAVGTVAAETFPDTLADIKSALEPLSWSFEWAGYAVAGLTLAGLAYVLWARWDDARKARR